MSKKVVIVADYTKHASLSLEELCEICQTSPDFIEHLIEYEIILPASLTGEWRFDNEHLQRIRKAQRLQRDLEVNLAGIALVLDLLDELEEMREKADLLEKLLK